MAHPTTPAAQGLYQPSNEHDACGVGFIAHIKGEKSHSIVRHGLEILDNLTHRGATGYDPLLGDGAGILLHRHQATGHTRLRRGASGFRESPAHSVR